MAWRQVCGQLRRAVRRGVRTAAPCWPFYLVVYAVGLVHLAEVHWLDPWAGRWLAPLVGTDVVVFGAVEAGVYRAVDTLWRPSHGAWIAAYYLAGFVALLAWTPPLVAMAGDRDALRRTLVTYPLLYALALPGYLLVPQLNPYVALELADPFAAFGPLWEPGYYRFTTPDNTFPSLHVAYTAALTVHLARAWPRWRGLVGLNGVGLVASVVLVRVHWLGDVAGGLVVAWLGLRLADRAVAGRGWLGRCVEWLEDRGTRGLTRVGLALR